MKLPLLRSARLWAVLLLLVASSFPSLLVTGAEISTTIRQITSGPRHHFFGYIGHVRTTPWDASGRYVLALRVPFQDRMPKRDDRAEIVLLDTRDDYSARVVEHTGAWNFQQGTMFYWNPDAPQTQFFFNDRDPETDDVFCVLFDLERGERVAEYRFEGAAFGNSGVAQRGGRFLAINYGRLARLRPVTGYPNAHDWTATEKHPADDGVVVVTVATREKRVLVSFAQLADALRPTRADVDEKDLFINHTLWSRGDRRIFFFVRGDFHVRGKRLDVPFTMAADGSNLRPLAMHIGGHPEWLNDRQLVGAHDGRQIVFDVDEQQIVDTLGEAETFPVPGGDVALSQDGRWFANGHGVDEQNFYTLLRLEDNVATRTAGVMRGSFRSGDLRIDPAPCWNRDGTQLLVGGLAADGTRQLFVIEVQDLGASGTRPR